MYHPSGCLREGARSYVKQVPAPQSHSIVVVAGRMVRVRRQASTNLRTRSSFDCARGASCAEPVSELTRRPARSPGRRPRLMSQTTVCDMESADPAGAALEFRPGGVPASQSPAPFVSGCSTRTPSPVRSPTPEFTPVNRARPALAAAPAGGAPEPLPRLEDGWWRTHGLPPQLVNRGRRHAAHRGGFRRPSHVRATASTATCSSASS